MKKVIKASDSGLNAPVDYTTHLDSEDQVRKAYEKYVRMYALSQAMIISYTKQKHSRKFFTLIMLTTEKYTNIM